MSFPDPILIVGCPRSGTSLTAGIIEACGAFGGKLRPEDHRNPKGYFENNNLADLFNYEIQTYTKISKLEALLSPGQPVPFDAQKVRSEVGKILLFEGYRGGPWYFKCPNALTNPSVMAMTFPDARWVIVKRDEADIRASASDEFFEVRSFKKIDVVGHFLKGLEEASKLVPDHIEIWPFKELAQDMKGFKSMIGDLGLNWNEQAVQAFADRSLVHHDSKQHLTLT